MPKHPITGCRADTLMGMWIYGDADGFNNMAERGWKIVDSGQLGEYIARSNEINEAAVDKPFTVDGNGIARMAITGPMTKHSTSMSSIFGGTSTNNARSALGQMRAEQRNGNIKGLFLEIDSGGGTVAGTAELAEAIRKTAAVMPVHVHAADMMASAALWVGTQGTRVTCGPSAEVGSLGTMTQIPDYSNAKDGFVKPRVFRSGKYKGVGSPGVALSKEVVADVQRQCDQMTEVFSGEVFSKRGIKPTSELADELLTAKVFIGSDAKRVKLVDAVCSTDDAYDQLKSAVEAVGRGPAPAPKIPATTKERTMLTAEQLQHAIDLTGTSMTAETADVALLTALDTASQDITAKTNTIRTIQSELTAVQAKIPAVPNMELLAGRAEIVSGKAEVLAEKGVITSAQLTSVKTLLCGADGNTPNVALLSGEVGKTAADSLLVTLSVGKPKDLFKENTQDQPAPRTTPGMDAVDGKPTMERVNHVRKLSSLAPLTQAEYDAKYGVAV